MRTILVLVAFASLAACDPAAPEQLVGAEACEHFVNGPYDDVTAAETATDAPDISSDHGAHRVTTIVLDAIGNRGGVVLFEPASAGETSFFLSTHIDIAATSATDETVLPVKSVHDVDACAEIAMLHVFDFAGGPYSLDLGPTQAETVTIVWQTGDAAEGDTGQHEHMD